MNSYLLFLIKYLFRLLHIGSYGLFSAVLIGDYVLGGSGNNISSYLTKFQHIVLGVILGASGLINMIILIKDNKYAKTRSLKVWKYLLYLKFVLFLLLTPLYDKFIAPNYYMQLLNLFGNYPPKLVFFIISLVLSPFLRFYRENYLIKCKID